MKDENRKLGGDEAQPSEPKPLPTVQAETAVVDLDRLRSIIHTATHHVLPFAEQSMKPFSIKERAAMQVEIADMILAAVAQQPPVSTGEQPGMSEGGLERVRDLLRKIWEADTHQVWQGNPPEPSHDEEGDCAKLAGQAVEVINAMLENNNCKRGGDEPQANAPTLPDDLLSLSEAATQGKWVSLPDSNQLYTAEGELVAHFSVIEEASLAAASVNFIRTLAAKQRAQK